MQRIIPHSDVKQFKYLKMLIQEFHVKVDLLFINEIVEMVSTELSDEESVILCIYISESHLNNLHYVFIISYNASQTTFNDKRNRSLHLY